MTVCRAVSAVLLFALLLSSWPITLAQCSETVPTGVERIGAQALWDNNKDKAVDEGANAGDSITVAIIDSGLYTDQFNQLHEDFNAAHINRFTVQWNEGRKELISSPVIARTFTDMGLTLREQ